MKSTGSFNSRANILPESSGPVDFQLTHRVLGRKLGTPLPLTRAFQIVRVCKLKLQELASFKANPWTLPAMPWGSTLLIKAKPTYLLFKTSFLA